jgi:hypothetical protein
LSATALGTEVGEKWSIGDISRNSTTKHLAVSNMIWSKFNDIDLF